MIDPEEELIIPDPKYSKELRKKRKVGGVARKGAKPKYQIGGFEYVHRPPPGHQPLLRRGKVGQRATSVVQPDEIEQVRGYTRNRYRGVTTYPTQITYTRARTSQPFSYKTGKVDSYNRRKSFWKLKRIEKKRRRKAPQPIPMTT